MSARFVWLASYPKSGNTWLRMLLSSLQAGGLETDINGQEKLALIGGRYELDRVSGIESSELTPAEIATLQPAMHRAVAAGSGKDLEFRKVHDMYWSTAEHGPLFPADVSLGVVYIVRDPRDVTVSYASHLANESMDDVIDLIGDKKATLAVSVKAPTLQLPQWVGSWSSNVASWMDQTAMPVLLVRYEDMLADAARELRRVAEFAGLPTDAVDAAVEASHFDRLQAQEQLKGFDEKPEAAQSFFRSGVAGEGARTLTAEQLQRITIEHGPMMRRLGYL